MTVIELRMMNIICSTLPKIVNELERVASALSSWNAEKTKCCICGEEIHGCGNNPWPLVKSEGARCCDSCNDKVLEARFKELKKKIGE